MIAVRSIRRAILTVSASLILAALVLAPAAFAESPWWHLSSGSLPANLQPGHTTDGMEKLTASATAGDVFLAEPRQLQEVLVGVRSPEELAYATFPYNASAQTVQEGVERVYPNRKVNVSEGQGDTRDTHSWVITFRGQSVELPTFASGEYAFLFGAEPLSCEEGLVGCTREANVTTVSQGRPDGWIVLTATNLGDAQINGAKSAVRLTDQLPPGLDAVSIEPHTPRRGHNTEETRVQCTLRELTCTSAGVLAPYDHLEVLIGVVLEGAKTGEVNSAAISGGEAPQASVSRPLTVSATPTPFGVEQYEVAPEEEGGASDTQAGSHPFQLTTTLTLNQVVEPNYKYGYIARPAALAKDLYFKLPPGLIGNPTPFPRCTLGQFLAAGPKLGGEDTCPPQTAVGVASVTVNEPANSGVVTFTVPMFNLEPSVGEPARFGFMLPATPVFLDTSVRTGGDYGVTVTVSNISQTAGFMRNEVTFWGVPGDPRHDNSRGWGCLQTTREQNGASPCHPLEAHTPPPLLALPTSCTGPLKTNIETDSWPNAGSLVSFADESMSAMDGCNRLPFSPSISVAPDGQAASTPTGLAVDVKVPQDVSLNPTGLAEADVKNTIVTLPAGVTLNPASADGLSSCATAQIALESRQPPACPDASKVGTVEIHTPLLPNPLVGAAYLAAQQANPFGSLVALYVFVEDPISGSRVKLAGEVVPDPVTGQLVSTFENTPQLPFEDFTLHFFGGERAPLATPPTCGSYTTVASIAPWSQEAGEPPEKSTSAFEITSGPNSSPCQSPLPFAPALHASVSSIQAGGFSPFTMTMSRDDGNQSLDAITLHMPPGVSGMLTGIPLCGEAQANEGTCPQASKIGETTVSVGLGGDPFTVTGGRVYITGPYKGAPYGLSIVNPAKAGPFDLENTVAHHPACDCLVVRAKIEVDPTTAALTITSDTTGPYRIPTILEGIPLQIKHVNVTVNRPAFTFNPTNCEKMAITGNLTSSEGAVDSLSVPFQVTNCAVLGFKPKFGVATNAHHTRTGGESLHVKLTYPNMPFGSQANIAKVRVELPKQLPSRLTTLQKACPDSVFNANPNNCPAASRVGEAIATTPIIPEDFRGPAYFVSHGGVKFPELIIALHGYALTVDLHGETFISRAGVTSTTFNTVPDVPIGTFELNLPAGPDSALAANGDLCAQKLVMPTTFTAQNGAFIKQTTPISVKGCSPEIRVIRHMVKGKHATVVVKVPSAGMLVADGGGVRRRTRRVSEAGTVMLNLGLSKAEQRFVAHHHDRRLQVPITLSFSPGHGQRLSARVAVLMR